LLSKVGGILRLSYEDWFIFEQCGVEEVPEYENMGIVSILIGEA